MPAMIVQRGLDPSYYFFTAVTMKSNDMAFIVDRRLRERRLADLPADVEGRAGERRGEPPASWARDGFMVT